MVGRDWHCHMPAGYKSLSLFLWLWVFIGLRHLFCQKGSLKILRSDCELSYGEVPEIVDTLKLHGRRFANRRRTSIWVEWLRHGRLRDDSIWSIPENRGPWGWRKMLRLRGWLRSVVEYHIGDGSDFFLWKDPWHHLGPLLDRFLRGPNSLGLHESTMLSSVICEGHWHCPLITDMECVEITHLLPRIHGVQIVLYRKVRVGNPLPRSSIGL